MFTEWNKAFDKLRHKHDTWYIFRDFLNMTIDNFTIPDQTPLFKNKEKYTEKEYEYFDELFQAYVKAMQKELENKPYCDFLGLWWESDQNMTNKFKAQFFTPMNVCELMASLCNCSDEKHNNPENTPQVMNDPTCGSGRFGLVHHHLRPMDYFVLQDLDDYAVKMTIVNMLFHGMQGVVVHQNTLTNEVFSCWRVTPYWSVFGGVPYVVPYGTDLAGACSFLPSGTFSTIDSDKNSEVNEVIDDTVTPATPTTDKKGGLDDWI